MNMGYDTMSAWDRLDYTLQSSRRTDSGSTNSNQPTSPTLMPPLFLTATRAWSPTASPISSPIETPITSPISPTSSPEAWRSLKTTVQSSPESKHNLLEDLYAAACAGDLDEIQHLLSRGAPINGSVLINGVYKQFTPAKAGKLSPLAGAAGHGQLDAAELLVAHGANVSPTMAQSSSSPLHRACEQNDLDIARFLLEAGADANVDNCYFSTPLMYAARFGSVELIDLILEYNADVHRTSFIQSAAIHSAVLRPSTEALQRLIDAGADVNHVAGAESTPLHLAVNGGGMAVVKCLLKHGADPSHRNCEYLRPDEVARQHNMHEIADLLASALPQG